MWGSPQGIVAEFEHTPLSQALENEGAGVYTINPRPFVPFVARRRTAFTTSLRFLSPTPPSRVQGDAQRFYEEILAPHLKLDGFAVVPAKPRSGKTIGAAYMITLASDDKRILYIAPTRQLAAGFALLLASLGVDALLHLGRGVGMVQTPWGDYDTTNCHPDMFPRVQESLQRGRTGEEVCEKCTHRSACLYWKTRAAATDSHGPRVVVSTHRSAEFLKIPADFVVVDEQPAPDSVSIPRMALEIPTGDDEADGFLAALLNHTRPQRIDFAKASQLSHPAAPLFRLLAGPGRVGIAIDSDSVYGVRVPVLRYKHGVYLDATPDLRYTQVALPAASAPPRVYWSEVLATLVVGYSRRQARSYMTDSQTRFDLAASPGLFCPGIGAKDIHLHAYLLSTRGQGGMEGTKQMVIYTGFGIMPAAAQVAMAAALAEKEGIVRPTWKDVLVGEGKGGEEVTYPFPAVGSHTDPRNWTEALQAVGRCFPTSTLQVTVYGVLPFYPRVRSVRVREYSRPEHISPPAEFALCWGNS